MADEDFDPQPHPTPVLPTVPPPDTVDTPAPPDLVPELPGTLELLREAGFTLTDGGLDAARARLDRSTATVTAESRVESRERLREIMGWS